MTRVARDIQSSSPQNSGGSLLVLKPLKVHDKYIRFAVLGLDGLGMASDNVLAGSFYATTLNA